MRAVVTAGGTSEPIDDVRVLTNLSTGRFGTAIANALAARGVEVTLLAGRALDRAEVDPRVRIVGFGSFADLSAAIDAEVADPPAAWWMAAAVSDYSPAPSAGKIRSDQETLTLTLRRNPKLLAALRPRLPATTIVGFKLLSRVSTEELVAVGRRQVVGNGLDWCVANDLAELGGGAHPVWLLAADGSARRIEGDRRAVAEALVDAVLPPAAPAVIGTAPAWGPGGRFVDRPAADPASALLLRAFPALAGLWWSSDALAVGALAVRPDAPAGSPILGEAALGAALRARVSGGFAARWPGGRVVVGVTDLAALERDGRQIAAALAPFGHAGSLRPIWRGGDLVGGAARVEDAALGDAWAPWILPAARGGGVGDAVAEALDRAGARVVAPTAEGLAGWWAARGFRERRRAADRVWFDPPSARDDLAPAASVCLVEPRSGQVLLGRRRRGPALGAWAFPGGRLRAGEAPLAGGLRELAEETGLRVEVPVPAGAWVVAAGDQPGFRITCTALLVPRAEPPAATDELQAAWFPLAEALALRPITPGTLRVLRALAARG